MALAHYPEWINCKSIPKSKIEHRMMPALRRDQPNTRAQVPFVLPAASPVIRPEVNQRENSSSLQAHGAIAQ